MIWSGLPQTPTRRHWPRWLSISQRNVCMRPGMTESVLPEDALPGTREERTAFRTGLKRAGSRSFIILAIIVFLDNLQGSGLSRWRRTSSPRFM